MKKGFTMIELLVVIAIIGLITAIILISIGNAKSKNRDARRMANMKQISNALNLYINQNRIYPQPYASITITGSDAFSTNLITSGAMQAVPKDPLNSGSYIYTYTSANGSTFTLGFFLETNTIKGYPQGANTITP